MKWTTIKEGIFAGKTVPEALIKAPSDFLTLFHQGYFDDDYIIHDAQLVLYRAQNILIPEGKAVKNQIDQPTGKFDHFDIVNDEPYLYELLNVVPKNRIDFSLPFCKAGGKIDRFGDRNLLKCFEYFVFGSRGGKLNKQFAEEYFADESNFIGK